MESRPKLNLDALRVESFPVADQAPRLEAFASGPSCRDACPSRLCGTSLC
ncbi:MAG TPA: hypothetical protein VF006_29775 [Longimicrobium sp.]